MAASAPFKLDLNFVILIRRPFYKMTDTRANFKPKFNFVIVIRRPF